MKKTTLEDIRRKMALKKLREIKARRPDTKLVVLFRDGVSYDVYGEDIETVRTAMQEAGIRPTNNVSYPDFLFKIQPVLSRQGIHIEFCDLLAPYS